MPVLPYATSGNVPLNIAFTDTSTGNPTTWNWNFGDGTGNSTAKNPTHTYSTAGNYTVTLTVSNSTASSSNATTKTNYIKATTTAVTKPVVSFWASRTSGKAPITIGFTDASTSHTQRLEMEFWRWNIFNTQEPKAYLLKSRNILYYAYSKQCSRNRDEDKSWLYKNNISGIIRNKLQTSGISNPRKNF